MDAIRADLAELRHEFDLFRTETKAEFAMLRTRLEQSATKSDLKDAMLFQTRWILGGLVVVLLAVLFKT